VTPAAILLDVLAEARRAGGTFEALVSLGPSGTVRQSSVEEELPMIPM
jgi:hypothetical protein